MAKLSILTKEMTESLNEYKLLEPARALRDFIDDLSTWYLRRSRERIKEGDVDAKQTLYFVLKRVSKLLAPFAPFVAEDLYQKLRHEEDPESVHLSDWPIDDTQLTTDNERQTENVIEKMNEVRRLVTLALEARQKANIKIRQPLSLLTVPTDLNEKYLEIIKDELNVKKVIVDASSTDVVLNTELTPLLLEEGEMREIVRSIQDLRKENGMKPGEKMEYTVPENQMRIFEIYGDEITRVTNIELS